MIEFAMSYDEIAESMGISRQRVTAIEKNALKKLHRRMERVVTPREPKQAACPEEMEWEAKYDLLYRAVGREV